MRVALVWVVFAACVQNPPPSYGQQQPQGGQPGYAQQQQQPAPQGLNCIQIVQCLANCGQDTSCYQPCIAQGDPAAQATVNALLVCNNQNGSEGCNAELQACSAASQTSVASAPQQQPQQQQPQSSPMIAGQQSSNENLLNWLVGSWVTANHQFTFWPGGKVRRANGAGLVYKTDPYDRSSSGRCVWTLNEVGQASIENGQLVMRFEAVDSNHCGEKTSSGAVTIHYQIEWIDNYYYRDRAQGLQLRLRDLDCPQKDDMYCLDSMVRRLD